MTTSRTMPIKRKTSRERFKARNRAVCDAFPKENCSHARISESPLRRHRRLCEIRQICRLMRRGFRLLLRVLFCISCSYLFLILLCFSLSFAAVSILRLCFTASRIDSINSFAFSTWERWALLPLLLVFFLFPRRWFEILLVAPARRTIRACTNVCVIPHVEYLSEFYLRTRLKDTLQLKVYLFALEKVFTKSIYWKTGVAHKADVIDRTRVIFNCK